MSHLFAFAIPQRLQRFTSYVVAIHKVRDYVCSWYNMLGTMTDLNTHTHVGDLTADTSWLITSLGLSLCLNFLVFKSCFLRGSLLFVMWLTHQNEVMIHAGVFKQVEVRPASTERQFPKWSDIEGGGTERWVWGGWAQGSWNFANKIYLQRCTLRILEQYRHNEKFENRLIHYLLSTRVWYWSSQLSLSKKVNMSVS